MNKLAKGIASFSGTTLEFNRNIVGGALLCSSGTIIEPGEDGDPSGNTVRGANTC
jgi:hypothetical protein